MASNFLSTPMPTKVEQGKSFIRPVYQFLKRTKDLALIPKAAAGLTRSQSLKVDIVHRDVVPQVNPGIPLRKPTLLSRAATFRQPQDARPVRYRQKSPQSGATSTEETKSVESPKLPLASETPRIVILEGNIRKEISSFPSVIYHESTSCHWSWTTQIQAILYAKHIAQVDKESSMRMLYYQACSAGRLLSKIRVYFETGHFNTENPVDDKYSSSNLFPRDKKVFDIGMLPYLTDIYKTEKAKEDVYTKWWSKTFSDIAVYKKRKELVKWVCNTGVILKYPAETIHTAVYIIDAYLRHQKVSSNEWKLLGITAVHIAGKLEEPLPDRLSRLISLSGQHVFRDAVFSMEKNILTSLKFDVYPPLPTFFAQMVLLAGDLHFINKNIQNHVVDLTMGILYNALMHPKLFSVKPSVKAQAAVETAVDYIYHQHRAYKNKDLSRYAFVTAQPGKEVGDFAVSICTDAFQQRFVKRKMFSNAPPSIDISSPKRNVKAN